MGLLFHLSFLPCICCSCQLKTAECSMYVLRCMDITCSFFFFFFLVLQGSLPTAALIAVTEMENHEWPCPRDHPVLTPCTEEGDRPLLTDTDLSQTLKNTFPIFFLGFVFHSSTILQLQCFPHHPAIKSFCRLSSFFLPRVSIDHK